MSDLIKYKFTNTFKNRFKANKTLRDGPKLTDEEILRIRKQMNIVPKDPKTFHMGAHQRPL